MSDLISAGTMSPPVAVLIGGIDKIGRWFAGISYRRSFERQAMASNRGGGVPEIQPLIACLLLALRRGT
jgi:hypothetical protein